jgi:hypothetical protein
LILNNLARGMSVANRPQSTTEHNEALSSSAKVPQFPPHFEQIHGT